MQKKKKAGRGGNPNNSWWECKLVQQFTMENSMEFPQKLKTILIKILFKN